MRNVTLLPPAVRILILFSASASGIKPMTDKIAVASSRSNYAEETLDGQLLFGKAAEFDFSRFQSSAAIKEALSSCRRQSSFKWHRGTDGRKGYVSSTKLGGDWVLAESEQVAIECSTDDVLRAYLSGDLQERWNTKEVLQCSITRKTRSRNASPDTSRHSHRSQILRPFSTHSNSSDHHRDTGEYYQQDLVLRSQRIIRSHTGIMRYSQTIRIDKIGRENYCISITLDPTRNQSARKPFDSLMVHVNVEQAGKDVHIYAAGVMRVNRKVVPNLLVFDASRIAGSMAGKGTLWLAGHFEKLFMERRRST